MHIIQQKLYLWIYGIITFHVDVFFCFKKVSNNVLLFIRLHHSDASMVTFSIQFIVIISNQQVCD